jgi:hypothetical protein
VRAVTRRAVTRRAAWAGLILACLAGPPAAAGPARAGAGVGCTGDSCSVLLSSLITLRGDDSATGSAQVPLPVTQPPCLWQSIGDTTVGSRDIISSYGAAAPGTPFGVFGSVQLARRLLRRRPVPPGFWWQLPVNPAATPAGQKVCQRFPLFSFAPPGVVPAEPPVPLRTLADYAYNHMRIPRPRLTINPAAKGYVNLATYVWGQTRPVSAVTGRPDAYEVSATLGAQTVSVWAQLAGRDAFSVGASGPGQAYSDCRAGGSHGPVGQAPANAGAGYPPDCGVLWQGPAATAAVQVTLRWTVSWGPGVLAGPGAHPLPPITITGQTPPFPVAEIQSINGG